MPTDHELRAMTDQIVAAYQSNPNHLPLSDGEVHDLARIIRDALVAVSAQAARAAPFIDRCGVTP